MKYPCHTVYPPQSSDFTEHEQQGKMTPVTSAVVSFHSPWQCSKFSSWTPLVTCWTLFPPYLPQKAAAWWSLRFGKWATVPLLLRWDLQPRLLPTHIDLFINMYWHMLIIHHNRFHILLLYVYHPCMANPFLLLAGCYGTWILYDRSYEPAGGSAVKSTDCSSRSLRDLKFNSQQPHGGFTTICNGIWCPLLERMTMNSLYIYMQRERERENWQKLG